MRSMVNSISEKISQTDSHSGRESENIDGKLVFSKNQNHMIIVPIHSTHTEEVPV